MSKNCDNIDQQIIDQIYSAICVQQHRCNHFNAITPTPHTNSVWNKSKDENDILNELVNVYKQYYQNKVEELKTKVDELKETNINSYLTYDKEFYVNEYNQHVEQLDKYLVDLDAKTVEDIMTQKLSKVSEQIDVLFPNYMVDPILLGKLLPIKEKKD